MSMSLVSKLRLSIASSRSQESEDTSHEDKCGFEIGCPGCRRSTRCTASLCQCFASTKWALAFLGLGAIVQGFLVNGHTPAVISTIEKRFELTSKESGLIASCYDIGGCLTILIATYIGGRGHKPLWIGWGMFLVGLGGVVFSLPHFTAPYYFFLDTLNLCGNAEAETCVISALKNYKYMFYFAMICIGIGASPLYSLGITYLDENVKQRHSSWYNGILIAMSIVGPGIGFLVGARFLKIFTYPEQLVSISESSEFWIGAWWLGALIVGIAAMLVAIPILMLPRIIPGTSTHRQNRGGEIHHSALEVAKNEEFGKSVREFLPCMKTLLKNPTFVFLSLGIAFDSFLINGFATFGAKYLEIQYGFDASDAGTYFGLMAILGGAIGQLVGGGLISKYNLKVKSMLHLSYIAPFLAALCGCAYFITCSDLAFAGVSVRYHDPSPMASQSISAVCNSNCGCSDAIYNPVCGSDGLTYFSPCFAGCTEKAGDVYTNCSCVAAITSGLSSNVTIQAAATAQTGACLDTTCSTGWQIIVFCIVNFFLLFLTFLNGASALQASLRCVAFNQRSTAIGVQVLVTRLLGTIPGPLVTGALFDLACSKWTVECGAEGSCLLYDNAKLSLYAAVLVVVGKLVDCIIFVGAMVAYKPVPVDEKEMDMVENQEKKMAVIAISNGHGPVVSPPSSKVRKVTPLPGEIVTPNKETTPSVFINETFQSNHD